MGWIMEQARGIKVTYRLVAVIVAFLLYAALILLVVAIMAAAGASDHTVVALGRMFTYTSIGIVLAFWRWPSAILRPASALFLCLLERWPAIAGANFVERLSTLVLLISAPVVAYWVIDNTDLSSSYRWDDLLSVFKAMWPGTYDWEDHPIGWACKGLGLAVVGRFAFTPLFKWLNYGRIKNTP